MSPELKSVVSDLWVHKKKLAIVAFAGIIMALCKGYLPLFIQQMVSYSNSTEKLFSIAWIGLAVAFAMTSSRYLHIFTMNVISEKVSQTLREKLQKKFIHLDLKFHNKYASGSGGLLSRAFFDVRTIQDGLRLFADVFSAPLTFIFLIFALFKLEWQLTLYILIAAPILAILLKQVSRGIRKYSLMGSEQNEKITSTIKESLDGVRTIQSFSLQNILQFKLKSQGDEYVGMRKKIHARIEFMGPFTEFLATVIVLGIVFYFSTKISKGLSDTSQLMGFITAMLQINEPIKKFQEAYVRIQETRVSAKRIYSMLEEKSELENQSNPKPIPTNWSQIEYKNIQFSYDDENILLKNFNLKIKRGQSVAFVGESGSGKSTVANLLARFYDGQSGEILFDDQNIKNFSLQDLRRNISLVSQEVFLFSDSIEKNIQAGSDTFDFNKIQSCAKAAFADEFIQRLPEKYLTNVGERGNLLSGGEKQRVAIARALYKDSAILILDEATSALDSVSEEQVQRGLDILMKGRTTLVIAHRLSTIQNADLIVVMKKGQIVESGTHDELMNSKSEYYKLFTSQTKV
jgi:ATP-binding cassette, subfamily B, bacterial MsbA